jgi:O-antigen/teichoic acid export membrane protein
MSEDNNKEPLEIADAWDILRGGAVNLGGFVIRGGGRIPFIFLAGILFGAEAVGRFAAITIVIQIAAAISSFGMRRTLFEALNKETPDRAPAIIVNGLIIAMTLGTLLAAGVAIFGRALFSESLIQSGAIWITLAIPMIAVTEVLLVSTLHKKVLRYHVLARSVAEPWTLSILSAIFALFAPNAGGLLLAYAGSIVAAFAVAFTGFYLRLLHGARPTLRPDIRFMASLFRRSAPTAFVDIIEYLFRRLDLFVLSIFSPGAAVGVYYLMRQIALLIQNVKQGFDPILAPVIANIASQGGIARAAEQLVRVSRWIFTVQLAFVVSLTITATPLIGFLGKDFSSGGIILTLLLAAELIDGSAAPWELAILFTRRKLNLACSVAGFIVYAGLAVALAKPFGAIGAASAFFAGLGVVASLRLIVVNRVLGATPLSTTFLKPIIAAAAAALVGYGVLLATNPWPTASLVLTITACLATFVFVLQRVGFDEADRLLFARLFKGAKGAHDSKTHN